MRLALAVVMTLALSCAVCFEVRSMRLPCRSCHARARLNGEPLLKEEGYSLLFATQADADHYAREYGQP